MRFFTPEERRLLDAARPSERVILRDLFVDLDARLVTGAAFGPRRDVVWKNDGAVAGVATRVASDASPGDGLDVGAAPEPLFSTEEAA